MSYSPALATPQVFVNDQLVLILPNSLSITNGRGERTVRAQSGGGGTVGWVTSENIETRFSDVKFKVITTVSAEKTFLAWVDNGFNNTVKVIDAQGFTKYFGGAGILNGNQEIAIGVDASFDVEFRSQSAV